MDAMPSRLRLALLNPLEVKSSSLEEARFRRKKKKNKTLISMDNIFSLERVWCSLRKVL